MQAIEGLVMSKRLAALIYSVKILLSHVVRLLCLTAVIILAFAAYLTCVDSSSGAFAGMYSHMNPP